MADGTIPQPEVDRLLTMGKWLKTNGEGDLRHARRNLRPDAGLGTQRPRKVRPDGRHDPLRSCVAMAADGKVLLTGIKQGPRSGKMLAGGAAVTSVVTPDGLQLTLPGTAPDPDVSVAALEFARPGSHDRRSGLAEGHGEFGYTG